MGAAGNGLNKGLGWTYNRLGAQKLADKVGSGFDWVDGHLRSPSIPTPKAPPPPPDEYAPFLREMSRQNIESNLRASKRSSYLGGLKPGMGS